MGDLTPPGREGARPPTPAHPPRRPALTGAH